MRICKTLGEDSQGFVRLWEDSRGFPRLWERIREDSQEAQENPLGILANRCESKENPKKMYSNGLKNILSIIYCCFFKLLTILFLF